MNVGALRTRFNVQKDTAFDVTLHTTKSADDAITVSGCQETQYDKDDVINYGPLMDDVERKVFLLPCLNCVNSLGVEVAPLVDHRIVTADGSNWVVNGVQQRLKGTWWRCVVSKAGR